MSRVENVTDEDDRLAFSQPGAICQGDDVRELRAALRRLALRNAGFTVSSITQIAKRLQRDRNDLVHWSAEVVLHRVLPVVGVALVTAAVAAAKIDLLRLVNERFELERQRLIAARPELCLLCRSDRRKEQDCQRARSDAHRRLSVHLITNGFCGRILYLSLRESKNVRDSLIS